MFDLLIRGAEVIDGTAQPRYRADLAVRRGKIAEIGHLPEAKAKRVIDGRGLFLTPGFIDVHCHTDLIIHKDEAVQLVEPLIRQGITTFVGGNCGMGVAPVPAPNREFIFTYWEAFTAEDLRDQVTWNTLGEYLTMLEGRGLPLNGAFLAPHGILRLGAVGPETRHAKPHEIQNMARWLEQAMDEGAIGLSTGLQYFPGSQSDTLELIDLARVVSRRGGVFTSHLRSYSATLPQAIDEVLQVAGEADVPVQISHLFWIPDQGKLLNTLTHGAAKVVSRIYEHVEVPVPLHLAAKQLLDDLHRRANAEGLRVGVDAMPTSAGFTHLLAFFPPWVLQARNREEIVAKLRDPKMRQRMRRDIEKGDTRAWPHDRNDTWSMNFFKLMGWGTAFIMSVPSEKNRHLEGRSLIEIGKMWKMHPFDAACELLLQEEGRVLVFETLTHPGDDFLERSVFGSMADPEVSIVTDAILMGFGRPSHLFYDCYPKFFEKYVRDRNMVTWETGVRKCSGLSADTLGLKGRGYLRPGYAADLVLLDPKTIGTNSTFDEPNRFPDGIRLVAINGEVVVDESGYHGDRMAGEVIKG